MPRPIVTLLTDFGTRDYYVAAVKGTILRLAPDVELVDVTHEVAGGDIEAGAFLLGAAYPAFPSKTVHLAVIDPGVGSARRILAVTAEGMSFVAPDNGLLTPLLGRAAEVRSVERRDLYLAGPGATFHGRDRFAPVAAYLARGGSFEELGPPVEDAVRLRIPPPERGPEDLRGRVVHVDRFGNLVTDLPSEWLAEGRAYVLEGYGPLGVATHYEALAEGRLALVPGSLGTLELVLKGDAANKHVNKQKQPIRIVIR